ncbi:MAG: response regulator [Bacteriovoracaceae bacterium]|nr:response regulator [Bacteriovoracaceae bacterium]
MILERPFNILILDDEVEISNLVKNIFIMMYGEDGFNLTVENDPLNAMKLIEKNHFHIVITDIYMPGMTGDEVIRRTLKKGKGTQVVVLTGDNRYTTIINSFLDGAMSFVSKPIDNKLLKMAIDLCLMRLDFWAQNVQNRTSKGSSVNA